MHIFMKNDKMLRALRIFGLLTRVWPLKDGASRLLIIFYYVLSGFYLLNDFCMIPALINGILYYQDDFANRTKAIIELLFVFELISSVFYCMAREGQFRKLLADLERADDKCSSPYEEILRRKFMFRVRVLYISSLIGYIMCGGSYIITPLILSQRRDFPLNTIFPFPMTESWAWYLVYTQNISAIMQVSLVIQIDIMIITILWNATFKFHLLGVQMHSVFTGVKLRAIIRMHQKVLDYAQEGVNTISFLIMKSMTIVFINTICLSMLVLQNTSFFELIKFVSIIIVSMMRFYIICWAAEVMTDIAYEISWRIYDSPWIYATPRVRRTVCMIMQRCQKSLAVKATSIVPMICVNFWGKVVSMGFSYILTLRTILGDRI